MARKKISQLESAVDVTASDLIQIVDVEDGDMAPSGTNKKATAQLLANELGKLTNVTATGSTTARSLANRFADVVNVKDFGAKGDGITDDTAAIQAAITSVGNCIYFPSGTYKVSSTLSASNKDLSLYGDGPGVSIISFYAGTHGINWTSTTADKQLSIDNLQLLAATNMSGNAVNASFGTLIGPVYVGVSLESVLANKTSTGAWGGGFYLNNARNVVASQSNFNGRRGVSSFGFKLDGQCLDTKFISCQVSDCVIGFDSDGASEGTYLTNCLAINVDVGVQMRYASGSEPLLNITSSHINAIQKCVEIENVQQSTITGNLFYAFYVGSMPGWVGVEILGINSGYNDISNNVFHGVGYTGTRNGVIVQNGFHNIITDNIFYGLDTAVEFKSPSSFNQDRFSVYQSVTTRYIDNGSNNIRLYNTTSRTGFSAAGPATLELEDRGGAVDNKITSVVSDDGTIKLNANNDDGTVKQVFQRNAVGSSSFGGDLGSESLRVNVGNFANRISILGRTSGSGPEIVAEGSDANINLLIKTKGTGAVFTYTLAPSDDNTYSLGTGFNRWSQVFAATGTINTSDEREKQQIGTIDSAILSAWGKVNFKQFKFNDAVEKKGDSARFHFGVIAQQVKDAFESEGLDAFEYGLLCYDTWEARDEIKDEDGNIIQEAIPAGSRYGVRYDEALALECAYQRVVTQSLQKRVEELENT